MMKIITGMHRSGTSLVGRLFYEVGADMGNPATFYAADHWNPDGYFEQMEILAINRSLIHGVFGRLAYFRLPSAETILRRARRMVEKIRSTGEKYRGKVVKETRYCLTLPAWLKHGVPVDRILVCLREPLAVARSLKKRNRITLRHGYRLWLEHNRRLLQAVGDIPLWFVSYRRLLDHSTSEAEIRGALQFFGLTVSSSRLAELQQRCVKPDMDHAPNMRADYPQSVEVLWQDLLFRHAQQTRSGR